MLLAGAYAASMWQRVRGRLLSGSAMLLMIAWLVCAVVIAAWVAGATGFELGRKGRGGLVLLIFLAPIGVVVAFDEFIIRRIRYGPPAPGRRKRGDLDLDQMRELDQRLKRGPDEDSAGA